MSQDQLQGRRGSSHAQRRLYKHGPVVPKPVLGRGSVRRRQRPEWDDHLVGNTHPKECSLVGAAGGCSPRPTAKQLLQEALARMQSVSSPRPQHAKRQRRGLAPSQAHHHPAALRQQPATAGARQPQLQQAKQDGAAKQDDSCDAEAASARDLPGVGCWEKAGQQHSRVLQAAARQALVKQHAFGGKPSWVDRPSASKQSGQYILPCSHVRLIPPSTTLSKQSHCINEVTCARAHTAKQPSTPYQGG